MRKSKHSFALWSIFFILLMGTFTYQTKKSMPDRAGHMVNFLEEGGQSRMCKSNTSEHLENQREESKLFTAEDPEIFAGSKCGKGTRSFGFPFPEVAEVHNRDMMHNHKKPVEFQARKINTFAAFGGFLEDTFNRCLGELGYWLSDLGLFSLERRRMRGQDCTLVNPPKVSEGHGTEDNSSRSNEISSQRPIRRMGKTRPATLGQVDQSESDIVDKRTSGNEVKRLHKMVKDQQRTGLGENADSYRVNETEVRPDQMKGKTRPAALGQVDHSEYDIVDKKSSGNGGRRLHKMVKDHQRIGLDENADSCRANETEDYIAAMGQRTSYVFHAIAFLAGLTFICCALRHWTKQPTQKEEVFNTACIAKNTEDIVRHKIYEPASRKWNRSTPEFKGHAGSPQEINPEASNENEQHQENHPQSDNDSKQSLDADQDQANCQPWTLKQPAHESKETIVKKVDEDQTSSTEGAEMQSPEENIDGNEFKGHAGSPPEITPEASNENEQHQEDRPQSDNDSKQSLDADQYQASCQPWTLKQPAHESKETIVKNADEDQTSSTEGAEMQSPDEKIDGNDVQRQHRNNLGTDSMEQNMPKARSISDIYIEPKITMKQHEHANLTGETNTYICEVEYHESFTLTNIDSDETTISVVYGAAGMGKTTLIQNIINDWAREVKFQEFSFVLPFKIQNLNAINSPIALRSLIIDSYPYFRDYLDHLWSEPKKLLFIFDDLHQLYRPFTRSDTHRNGDPRYRGTDTESEYFVSDIVRCLLKGELLRGCSVLITTRDWKLEVLHHVTPDSTFEVMGFTSEKAKKYFRRYLRNGQKANTILEFIEQSNILWNMCSDPLFCVTLASSLESFQAQGEEQTTIPIGIHTQVLSDYVAQLLAKCGYDGNTNQKCLSVVGELADKGIRQNTLLIEGDALTVLDSCPPMFISAFLYQDPDKQSDGVIYEFRHSVLRDFLAALTNVLNASVSRLKQILDERSTDITGRFSVFSIFLFGLSSRKSTDRLERELQTFPTEVTSCISEWITQSVSRRLKDMDTKHTQRMFLCILYCLLEFRDNEIMKEVLNLITTIKLNHLRLKTPDCIVLSRTLISLQMIQELDLSSCFAQPVAIWKLEKVLPRCVILRLNQNKLQDSGVKRLFDVLKNSKVKTLALKSNYLTDNCLESVFSALTKTPSLMQLNLSNSSQDEKQANQFTDEKLKYHYERSAQQKEIKWLRIKNIGQDFTRSSKESNCLTLITD